MVLDRFHFTTSQKYSNTNDKKSTNEKFELAIQSLTYLRHSGDMNAQPFEKKTFTKSLNNMYNALYISL